MPVSTVHAVHATRRRSWDHASRTAAVVATIAGASLASAASVQPENKKQPTPVLVVDYAGAGALLVDKKDRALKDALAMLPTRIRELPGEIPGADQIPPPVLDTLLTLLTNPARLAVTFDQDRQDEGMFGLGAVISFGPGEEKAVTEMHGTINAVLAMAGGAGEAEASTKYDQMLEIPSPAGGIIRYGPRQGKDGWRYEMHAGVSADPDGVFGALPSPMAGLTTIARAKLDFRPIGPAIEQHLEAMGGDAGEQVTGMLKGMGIVGPDAIRYSWQSGYTKDEMVSYTTIEGLKKHAKNMGVPTTPLKDSVFALIPSDASVAALYQADLSGTLDTIKEALEQDPNAAQGLEQFEGATGVNPIDDLLGCLGGTFGFYMSESTGGQLASMIAFVSLSDRARFEQAHLKLVGFANAMLASEEAARGYAKVRSWTDGDTQLFSMAFPGIPVPVEVTWALQGDWLVVGMMPQSTLAAARQIAGKGDKGLRDNKSFAALLPAGKQLNSFSFIDSPKLMKDGYQYVCLAGSAIANAVRSPHDPDREPGLIVPPLNELRAGAKPLFTYAYWSGDDYVTESHADRSFLVNTCGVIGAASPFFPLIGAAIGAAGASGQNFDPGEVGEMFDQLIVIP